MILLPLSLFCLYFSREKLLREKSSTDNLKLIKNVLPNKSEVLKASKNDHGGWRVFQLITYSRRKFFEGILQVV